MSYWAVVVARNAAPHLPRTLDSLLHQTLEPRRLVVVDDGSTDRTAQILQEYETRTRRLTVVTRPDKGYDIRRVPSNVNLAWERTAAAGLKTDFFMVSGDDCFYPVEYAEFLISRMQSDRRVVVASGRPSSGGGFTREHSPSGSGRMISCSFWRKLGEQYPLKAGWETWLLYKASQEGLAVRLFDDLAFEHTRPRGSGHQFAYWGAAMGALGYHPLYAMGRIAKNALVGSVAVRGSLNMLRGYLQAQLGSEDPFISPFELGFRKHVNKEQAHRIAEIAVSLVGR